jgi:hypothetical protein
LTSASVELVLPKGSYTPPKGAQFAVVATPAQVERVLHDATQYMRVRTAKEIGKAGDVVTASVLDAAYNLAWNAYSRKWKALLSPVTAAAYASGIRQSRMGRMPKDVLDDLALDYAKRMGEYFQSSSKDALLEGFNGYLNRKVPSKLAATMALQGLGLTPRQMRAMVAAKDLQPSLVSSVLPQNLKRKLISYVGRSLEDRFRKFSEEEIHRAEQHAHQLVWLYRFNKGQLSEGARRQWVTADDEKVCKHCGPLHMQVAHIQDPFNVPGSHEKIWTPGLHVNCRCTVRLIDVTHHISKAETEEFEEKEHPRWPAGTEGGLGGQFRPETKRATVRREPGKPAPVTERELDLELQQRIQAAMPTEVKEEKPVRRVVRQPMVRSGVRVVRGSGRPMIRGETQVSVQQPRAIVSAEQPLVRLAPAEQMVRVRDQRGKIKLDYEKFEREYREAVRRSALDRLVIPPEPEAPSIPSFNKHTLTRPIAYYDVVEQHEVPSPVRFSDTKGNEYVDFLGKDQWKFGDAYFVAQEGIEERDRIEANYLSQVDRGEKPPKRTRGYDPLESLEPISFQVRVSGASIPSGAFVPTILDVDTEKMNEEQEEALFEIRNNVQLAVNEAAAYSPYDWLEYLTTHNDDSVWVHGTATGAAPDEAGEMQRISWPSGREFSYAELAYHMNLEPKPMPADQVHIYVAHSIDGDLSEGERISEGRTITNVRGRFLILGERDQGNGIIMIDMIPVPVG